MKAPFSAGISSFRPDSPELHYLSCERICTAEVGLQSKAQRFHSILGLDKQSSSFRVGEGRIQGVAAAASAKNELLACAKRYNPT
jgi:hypothetical protein